MCSRQRTYSDAHSITDTNTDCYPRSESYSNSHADPNSDSYRWSDAVADTHPNPDTNGNSDAKAQPVATG